MKIKRCENCEERIDDNVRLCPCGCGAQICGYCRSAVSRGITRDLVSERHEMGSR